MDACRLLITGASGSGTTTLGRVLSTRWAVPHADADDYFWVPTPIPYTVKRDGPARLKLVQEIFAPRPVWVLSGSVMEWGASLLDRIEAVIFLELEPTVRLSRLNLREARRYGKRIEAGGDRQTHHEAFIAWAHQYDDDDFDGRSRRRHEEWLASLSCPVLRLDSSIGVSALADDVMAWRHD